MMGLRVVKILACASLIFQCSHVYAQEYVAFQAYETVYNGQLAIYVYCGVTNNYTIANYPGVQADCRLFKPDGTLAWSSSGGLDAARAAVVTGIPHEMVLLDLYEALRGLDSLTGTTTTTEDVLRLIFSRFCIGK